MGSGGSKAYCGGASSSGGGGGRKGRSKGRRNGSSSSTSRVFQSSCLGAPSSGSVDEGRCIDHHAHCHERKENGANASSANNTEIESNQVKVECYPKVKVEQPSEMACVAPIVELDEWSEASTTNSTSRPGSSSARATSAQSLTSTGRFLSRFSFVPGNVSFRLSRATSLGSSRTFSIPPTRVRVFNDQDEVRLCPRSANGGTDGDETHQGCDVQPSPTSHFSRAPTQCDENASAGLQFNGGASSYLDNVPDNQTISFPDRVGVSTRTRLDGNLHSPRFFGDLDSVETRLSDRRAGAREPVERNVRFSRTLSVGRLRDRVLRRSSPSDITFCPLQQERGPRDSSHVGRQTMGAETSISEFESNTFGSPSTGFNPSRISSSVFSFQDRGVETSRSREARYHDLLEHRSNFLERRRRIRSQVRALQRLGSRFENLSGHERSCILSGQHRMGRCSCRADNRGSGLDDNTSARASISRIVMLAEALFEVLDEIHQQSVVLSSRPSISSLGSIPAPNEIVESLPVKLYVKSQKHQNEEAAQCYICLVEYDEGDCMRVLPCQHEFHRTCIDKWLKEIHRVCPLCRGDICRYDPLPAEA